MQRLKLSRGDLVLNGGLYTTYRKQLIDVKQAENPLTSDRSRDNGYERRGAEAVIPDAWVQLLWNKLRFEARGGVDLGIDPVVARRQGSQQPVKIRMWGTRHRRS
jgi:hypothetical protein